MQLYVGYTELLLTCGTPRYQYAVDSRYCPRLHEGEFAKQGVKPGELVIVTAKKVIVPNTSLYVVHEGLGE